MTAPVAGPTLLSCQRNEGDYLLEWLAYHRSIGFERIVVFSNDCTDGSDDLLDRLASLGLIEHHRNVVPEGEAPQFHAAKMAMQDAMFAPGEWLMWLDTDEFLNVHAGGRHVGDLIAKLGDAEGICVNWRLFGSAGVTSWPGRQLDPVFTRASRQWSGSNRQIKTLFRMSDYVTGLDPHRPFLSDAFVADGRYYLSGAGRRIPAGFYPRLRSNGKPDNKRPGLPSFRLAQVNHYAVRTPDKFAEKRARGRGYVSKQDVGRHDDALFRRWDRNAVADKSILPLVPAADEIMAKWKQELNSA